MRPIGKKDLVASVKAITWLEILAIAAVVISAAAQVAGFLPTKYGSAIFVLYVIVKAITKRVGGAESVAQGEAIGQDIASGLQALPKTPDDHRPLVPPPHPPRK